MRATRPVGAGVAAVVILAALGAGGCARKHPTAAATVASSALRFLPKETAGVAVLEASRLQDRAALTRWLGESMGEATRERGYAAIRGILGSDFLQKVDRAAVALVPDAAPAATVTTPGWAAILEGRFDEKTLASIGPEGTLVTLFEASNGPELSLLALPDKALAIGPRATLEKLKSVIGHPEAGLTHAGLLTALGKVAADAQAWGAIDYPPLTDLARGAMPGTGSGGSSGAIPMLASQAGALKSVAFEARIAAGVDFTLVGVAGDTKGAKRLSDALRGLVALARMGAGNGSDKTWFEFLDGLRISEDQSDIRLTGNLTRPMMDAMLARAGQTGWAGGAPSGAAPNPAPAPPGHTPAARP
ncbi:MAG TPA: hypothetical protein VMQ62_13955 [Dongiaceae bacterium]|nr:hypothetical protein [Dongiaceae bacterium]